MASGQESMTLAEYSAAMAAAASEAAETYPSAASTCTYDEGYKYQAVYVCFTCVPGDDGYAGVCETCAVMCHTSHDVRPIWERRAFRCDCGTPAMAGRLCSAGAGGAGSLVARPPNTRNKYNANFREVYCLCKKAYDSAAEGDMYQCLACEDWFHAACILAAAPPNLDHPPVFPPPHAMLCPPCTSALVPAFLGAYFALEPAALAPAPPPASSLSPPPGSKRPASPGPSHLAAGPADPPKRAKVLDGAPANPPPAAPCKLDDYTPVHTHPGYALMLPRRWPVALCTCPACKALYAEHAVSFFLNPPPGDDASPAAAVPAPAAVDADSEIRSALASFINSLPLGKDVEMTLAVQAYTASVKRDLAKFAATGRVVTDADVRAVTRDAAAAAASALAHF